MTPPAYDYAELMRLTPECNCCRRRLTRIILSGTAWNESGSLLFHCLVSGRLTPIQDISVILLTGRQEAE